MLHLTLAASLPFLTVLAAGACAHAASNPAASTGLALAPMSQPKPSPAPGTAPAPATPKSPVAAAPVCVVELFSSEGCSSCPSAEEVANAIAAKARKEADSKPTASTLPAAGTPPTARTIVLAFHVDYWDNLGWKDRFASSAFTQRQRDYADRLKLRGLYTPQMIIGGTAEFVGSDSARASREIAQASASPAKAQLTMAATWQPAGPGKSSSAAGSNAPTKVAVTAKATAEPGEKLDSASIEFILIENGLTSKVTRGENSGRTLHHDRVVRTIATLPLKADGSAATTIELPSDANPANCRIVTIVREPSRWTVLGADEIALPALPARATP